MENAKTYLIVIGVSLAVSLGCNLFLGKSTEANIWKQTAIEKITEVSFLRNADQRSAQALGSMRSEFAALKNEKVDMILNKYMPR